MFDFKLNANLPKRIQTNNAKILNVDAYNIEMLNIEAYLIVKSL